jgi:predicted molibdopterin-dependent oxidoreductase YjgC
MIKFTIDGKSIETQKGKTILEAARDNGIYIPTLCYHANLLSIGSCRICIVEVDGYTNPMVSCATAAQDGMTVHTQSGKLFAMRQDYLKLLLSYHPLECPICDAGGECDLQDLVFEHKIEKADLTVAREHRVEPYSTPLIKYFDNRCVLCLRCIHACREVSGRNVLDLAESGIEARMKPARSHECISCGECLFVCPVGSLTENLSPLKSRFWQVERHATTCPHCGFGCTFELDVFEHRYVTDVIPKVENMPNRGSLCVMGRFGYDFVNHEAKLARPPKEGPVAVSGPVPAEKAKAVYAELVKLGADGKATGFIVSPRATNEEIFLIKQIAGRLPKASVATSAFYHTGKVRRAYDRMNISHPYRYDDLLNADLIVIAGANLLSNNHVLGNRVRDAFKVSGAKIMVIDPAPTPLTRIADAHLNVAPGMDGALFDAFSRRLIAEGKHPAESEAIEGYQPFSSSLKETDDGAALTGSGIGKDQFEKAYGLISKARNIAVIFSSGISSSDDSLRSLLNFCLLAGSHKKGLIMPVARESNAVGAATILGSRLSPDEILRDEEIKGLFFFQDDPYHYLNGGLVEMPFRPG